MTQPMTVSEKIDFSDAASEAIDHEIVQNAITELISNMKLPSKGLHVYGMNKIAHHAAVVARAFALGIDPDELRI